MFQETTVEQNVLDRTTVAAIESIEQALMSKPDRTLHLSIGWGNLDVGINPKTNNLVFHYVFEDQDSPPSSDNEPPAKREWSFELNSQKKKILAPSALYIRHLRVPAKDGSSEFAQIKLDSEFDRKQAISTLLLAEKEIQKQPKKKVR